MTDMWAVQVVKQMYRNIYRDHGELIGNNFVNHVVDAYQMCGKQL